MPSTYNDYYVHHPGFPFPLYIYFLQASQPTSERWILDSLKREENVRAFFRATNNSQNTSVTEIFIFQNDRKQTFKEISQICVRKNQLTWPASTFPRFPTFSSVDVFRSRNLIPLLIFTLPLHSNFGKLTKPGGWVRKPISPQTNSFNLFFPLLLGEWNVGGFPTSLFMKSTLAHGRVESRIFT